MQRETRFDDIRPYWDEEIPLPALQEGKTYSVRYTGRNIIAISE